MAIKVDTATAPAIWASYLIHGDSSGLEESDIKLCDEWCESIAPYYVVSDIEESGRFTWYGRLYGADFDGIDVCDYVLHSIEESE